MSTINTKDAPWTTIWSTSWPLPGYQQKPKNEIIREVVTDVYLPEDFPVEPYCLHLEVAASSGDWKGDWYFDGIGITKND